jgi:hypothetical protein
MSDQTVDQSTDTAVEAPATVQLQLQDLMLAAQVIQLVNQRGAFKAEEMEQVGGLYSRIVAFLQASGALKPAESTDAPAASDDTTAETTASDTDAPAAQ